MFVEPDVQVVIVLIARLHIGDSLKHSEAQRSAIQEIWGVHTHGQRRLQELVHDVLSVEKGH